MKNPSFLLLAALPLLVLSCKKEDLPAMPQSLKKPTTEPVVAACAWTPCEQAIAETKQAYQALANELCDTVWVDITCCQDEQEAFALVFVAPNDPACLPAALE